jgi:hypothetical protein
MRLRVRHARERVGLCCVGLVRHGDGCVGEGVFGGEKEGCRNEGRTAGATKVQRLEILGLRSRRTDWRWLLPRL